MRATRQRLYINVDHVATLRQARRTDEPDPVVAADLCEQAGADGITAHLREDRRHIQDDDVRRLAATVRTVLNLEMALTEEMLGIALSLQPFQVTFVPERREEITTEGGRGGAGAPPPRRGGISRLKRGAIRSSLFSAPDRGAVPRARDWGADAGALHPAKYAHAPHG